MDNVLRIDTGLKRLVIGDGPEVVEFNPTDVKWAELFQGMRQELLNKVDELQARSKELEAKAKAPGTTGVAAEIEKSGLALRTEVCVYMREKIDRLFGENTSQKVFGDLMSEYAITSFLEQVSPYIQIARAAKVAAYVPHPQTKKRKGKAVMK